MPAMYLFNSEECTVDRGQVFFLPEKSFLNSALNAVLWSKAAAAPTAVSGTQR